MGEIVYFCIRMKKVIVIITLLVAIVSCLGGEKALDKTAKANGDSIAYHVAMLRQQDHSLSIIDSLEQAGMLTPVRADFWRGYSCDMCWNTRQALHFYQKAFDAYTDPISEWNHYLDTGYRLAYMHSYLHEYREALRLATMLIDKASSARELRETQHAFLIELVIICQLKLGQTAEVKENTMRAYKMLTDGDGTSNENLMTFTYGRASDFLHAGDLNEADAWLKRCVDALHRFENEANDSINLALAMEYHGHTSLLKASILLARGQRAESSAVYDAIPQSQFYHPSNVAEAAEYLMAAERYEDALVFYARQDSMDITHTTESPLDMIHEHMIPHFKAFLKAGHIPEALEVAENICDKTDSALTNIRKDDLAQLSVVYQMQQNTMDLQRAHIRGSVYLLIMVLLFLMAALTGWLLFRSRRYSKELEAKNRELSEEVKLCEHRQQRTEQQLLARPQEELSAAQKLYLRICELMEKEKPFTNANLKREHLAAMLGTNHSYLGYAIRECANGQTISTFIDAYRTEYAAQLLATTDQPIGLVVEMAGFNNRVHFNKLFRLRYQLTPSEYRKITNSNRARKQ